MNSIRSHFFKYQFPAIAWGLFITFLSSIPAYKLPKLIIFSFDKIGHGSLFFVFGWLVYRALEPRLKSEKFEWKRVIISIGVVILYGVIDELHQSFVPGRTLDVFDMLADTAGGVLSAVVVYLQFRRSRRKLSDEGRFSLH